MITIRIFNVNKFEIEKEFSIDLEEEIIKNLLQSVRSLEYSFGIKAKIDFLEISDFDRFYFWIVKKLYPGYMVINNQRGQTKGTPDFNVLKDNNDSRWKDKNNSLIDYGEQFRMEVKRGHDTLSFNQMEWIFNNAHSCQMKVMLIKEGQKFD